MSIFIIFKIFFSSNFDQGRRSLWCSEQTAPHKTVCVELSTRNFDKKLQTLDDITENEIKKTTHDKLRLKLQRENYHFRK